MLSKLNTFLACDCLITYLCYNLYIGYIPALITYLPNLYQVHAMFNDWTCYN